MTHDDLCKLHGELVSQDFGDAPRVYSHADMLRVVRAAIDATESAQALERAVETLLVHTTHDDAEGDVWCSDCGCGAPRHTTACAIGSALRSAGLDRLVLPEEPRS